MRILLFCAVVFIFFISASWTQNFSNVQAYSDEYWKKIDRLKFALANYSAQFRNESTRLFWHGEMVQGGVQSSSSNLSHLGQAKFNYRC